MLTDGIYCNCTPSEGLIFIWDIIHSFISYPYIRLMNRVFIHDRGSHFTAAAFLAEYSGYQIADQTHIQHGAKRVGCDGTAAAYASDKVIISQSGQCAAQSEQHGANPFLDLHFQAPPARNSSAM